MEKKRILNQGVVAVPAPLSSQDFETRNAAIRQQQLDRLYQKYPSDAVPQPQQQPVAAPQLSLGQRFLNFISSGQQAPPVQQLQERSLTPDEELRVTGQLPQLEILKNKKYMLPPAR